MLKCLCQVKKQTKIKQKCALLNRREGPERHKSAGSHSLSAVVEVETSLLDTLTVTVADSFEDLATDCR